MKKFISIICIVLIASMLFGSTVYANDAWETDPVDISDEWEDPAAKPIPKVDIKKCSISNIKNATYTGKAIAQSPVIKYSNKTLKKGTDYTLSYKANTNIGVATVIIKGAGNYTGSVSKTFKIIPKGTSISKVTKPKSKQLKITWKKQKTKTTGYQVQVATDKAFTKNKKSYTSSKNTVLTKTFKNLKKKKKYYVRVRTYKTVKGTKYYSSWSKLTQVKTR